MICGTLGLRLIHFHLSKIRMASSVLVAYEEILVVFLFNLRRGALCPRIRAKIGARWETFPRGGSLIADFMRMAIKSSWAPITGLTTLG